MNLHFIKNLGGGGFGVVDLVQDQQGNTFARKSFSVSQPLPPQMVKNVRKRFALEARTQSGINHPNIVPVLYADMDADPPFYLMPQAVCSLQDDLSADRTLGGSWLSAINDIVAALDELHSAGIYHRDLKPQNVLKYTRQSTKDPEFYYAVSDFGLIAMNETRVSVLTVTGMAKGTDYYTAPEITSDLRQASPQSDIYSLGCILHEMVGQRVRIPCNEIKEDGPYGAILRNCTRSDPARRFGSVRSVLDAIVTVASGLPPVTTAAASEFAEKLASGELLDEMSWRALVTYVEDNEGQSDANAVLIDLSPSNWSEHCEKFPVRFGWSRTREFRDEEVAFQ